MMKMAMRYGAILVMFAAGATDSLSVKHVDTAWFMMATAAIWALLAIAWPEDKHE